MSDAFDAMPEAMGTDRLALRALSAADAGSRRVLEKLGMSHEGTMRRSHLRHDGYQDMDLFSVLREERRA